MDELSAFLDALDRTAPDALTRCPAWTAHDLLAHMVAGTEEMAQLIERAAALLAQPDLLEHGRLALASMPTLQEARRTPRPGDDLLSLWGRAPDR